jgi:hypothetical protein
LTSSLEPEQRLQHKYWQWDLNFLRLLHSGRFCYAESHFLGVQCHTEKATGKRHGKNLSRNSQTSLRMLER